MAKGKKSLGCSQDKSFFDPVDTKVDFPQMEKKLLDHWHKKGIVTKYLQKNKNSKKYFSFLDGPITANNPMGVHHGWGRTYKDLWQRFKNMQGYRQRFQNGFDCQGLWVEVEVERELGFKSKKDIEKYGVAKFVKRCKQRVFKFAKIQTEQSKRLGYFVDWNNSYFTLSEDNNYMIWKFLKICHENGWLYKGNESVPWCPRCETAISQHEMLTEDYKEIVHDAIYFELPIEGRDNELLLVWTTTPWTIPANIAVAVDKDLKYALVQGATKAKFWVAKESVERIFSKKAKTLKVSKGSDLVGLHYKSPFDNLPAVKKTISDNKDKMHTVIATDLRILPISTSEGTGLVHTAVSAGSEDFQLGKKLGLPMIPVIADNADYLDGLGFLTGKNAKKHPEIILDYLRKEDQKKGVNWVFDIHKYKHRYPCCWRCKTELVWKVTDEWYIAMDKPSKSKNATLRERMKKVAKAIHWIPEFGLKRELDWLENMHDWLISKKNRYWGLALPIWECSKCAHFTVIGSKDELKDKAVKGWDKFAGKSPHKPQVDAIKLNCDKCGTLIDRIEPVGNPWLDAGIVAYSTVSSDNSAANPKVKNSKPLYLHDRNTWKKWIPADFITESFPGQFKNWFYSLIAMSTVLEDIRPFKTVLGYGTLLAEDGRPMHKSWGNAIEFNEGAEKMGVDVMRWLYVKQNPSEDLLFGYKIADEVRRRFHLKLWNIYNFFVTYANLDEWSPSNIDFQLDTRLKNKSSVLDKWILSRLIQSIKVVTNSLENYDACLASTMLEEFVNDFSNWYIRRSRERVGLQADDTEDKNSFYETTYFVLLTLSKLLAPFTPFISETIYRNLTKKESVHLDNWPKEPADKVDLMLIKEMAKVRDLVEKVHAQRKETNIPVRQPLLSFSTNMKAPAKSLETLVKNEVNVKNISWGKGGDKEIKVKLNKKITPKLEEEAKTRELIRKVQTQRKSLGIDLQGKIELTNSWIPEDKDLLIKLKKICLIEKIISGEFKVRRTS